MVQIADMPDQPHDPVTKEKAEAFDRLLGKPRTEAEVDIRSDELSKEFTEHRDEFIKQHPTATDSTIIFQAWAMQKIAGLQLQAEKNLMRICQLESRK